MVEMLRFASGGVELSGAFRPSRGRPTVIFCHGYPGRNLNEETAESLAARGYGSLVFSYRGARGSPGTYSLYQLEDDARAALDALRGRSADGVGLLGYSMGGFAAVRLAAREPSVADFLVLLAPVTDLRRAWTHMDATWPDGFEGFIRGGVELLRGDPDAWIAQARALASEPQPVDLAPALSLPVLLLHGRRDDAVPFEQSALLHESLYTRKRLIELDSDHDLAGMGACVAAEIDAFVGAAAHA